jgi:hypothetical protein
VSSKAGQFTPEDIARLGEELRLLGENVVAMANRIAKAPPPKTKAGRRNRQRSLNRVGLSLWTMLKVGPAPCDPEEPS